MSNNLDPENSSSWLSRDFKNALFPSVAYAYIGHYQQKWLPDTAVVTLIKLE